MPTPDVTDTVSPDPTTGTPDPTPPAPPRQRDPEAPYGRKPDGTPYKVDPSVYAKRDANRKARKGKAPGTGTTAPAPPRKPTTGQARQAPKRPDYRTGIVQLCSLPAGVLVAAGGTLGRRDLLADGATISYYAPGVADALQGLADNDPRVAAVLDKVLSAGPYGALVAALVPMFAQVAANHGLIKPGAMGTTDPDTLVSAVLGTAGPAEGANGAGPDVQP
jgi:hypothetical protein